jgi:hypothetical protein
MTRRVLLAALAASLVLPAAGSSQSAFGEGDMLLRAPRLQIAPFIGHLTSVNRIEEWSFSDGTGSYYTQADVSIGGATAFGLIVEAPLTGPFGVTAAAAYGARDATTFVVMQNGDRAWIDGAHVMLARLGVAFHLPAETSEFVLRRLGASAFLGGAVAHERPRVSDGAMESGTHFGVNAGVNAEIPFADDRFAVQLGIEDNMLWWNENVLAGLPYEYLGRPGQSRAQTVATSPMSHTWLLRAGFSWRMR